MKNCKYRIALTLVEMLIVVSAIALLATMVIGIATRIDNQSKERLVRNTIAIITNALEQFYDYGYRYADPIYSEFEFPLDCNDSTNPQNILEPTLAAAFGLNPGAVSISGGLHDPNYSGSEALYFFLSRVPTSRITLEEIDGSLITKKGLDDQDMDITITLLTGETKVYPLFRIIDPWGTSLHYDYYDETVIPPDPFTKRTFPVVTSAGADKIFGTTDDITSK